MRTLILLLSSAALASCSASPEGIAKRDEKIAALTAENAALVKKNSELEARVQTAEAEAAKPRMAVPVAAKPATTAAALPAPKVAPPVSRDDPYQRLEERAKLEGWTPERLERAKERVDVHLEREANLRKLSN